jgi:hypothetical protein
VIPPQPPPDDSIIVVPNPAATALVGATQPYRAIGNVTSNPYTASWSSSNTAVATVASASGTETTATCVAAGDANINVSVTGIAGATPTVLHCVTSIPTGTINLSDCASGTFDSGWRTMSSGAYTINFPSCTTAWTAGVDETVPAAVTKVTIVGKTTVNCTGASGTSAFACTATDSTRIQDSFQSATPLMKFTMGAAAFRITGMTIEGGADTTPKNPAMMQISGAGGNPNFRFDHSHLRVDNYTSGTYMDFIRVFTIYGVMDHDIFNMAVTANAVDVFNGADGDGYGDHVWGSSSNLGGDDYIFLEDDIFTAGQISDCAWAGKVVVRNSTSSNQGQYSSAVHNHGTSDRLGRWRGCRVEQAYRNYISSAGANAWLGSNGGVTLGWGNTIAAGYGKLFAGGVPRTDGSTAPANNPPAGWGWCGTSRTGTGSAWDGNSVASTGYPCLDSIGRGKGDVLNGQYWPTTGPIAWPHELLEPTYLFMNTYTVGNVGYLTEGVTQFNRDVYGDCGAAGSVSGCGSAFDGSAGTGYGTLAARPASCKAGPGGTFGVSPTGSYGVGYWATDQNTLYVCTSANTWTGVYTPYTYPHPLTTTMLLAAPFDWTPVIWIALLVLAVAIYFLRKPIARRFKKGPDA